MPVDNHVKKMLEELKSALAQTIRSSYGVTETIRKIRDQGFDLHLVLSFDADSAANGSSPSGLQNITTSNSKAQFKKDEDLRSEKQWQHEHGIELTAREAPAWVPASGAKRSSSEPRSDAKRLPTFRLSGYDVSLLQSLGIDPTRKGRPNRRRRPPGPA